MEWSDAGCQLGAFVPLHRGLSVRLSLKTPLQHGGRVLRGRVPREGEQVQAGSSLQPTIRSQAVSLPPHWSHRGSPKVLPRLKRGKIDSTPSQAMTRS